jgi:uncharacterized phage protein (TIGR01671 family)
MREIKFRAWDKRENEYNYDKKGDHFCDATEILFRIKTGSYRKKGSVYKDSDWILEQYTGLKDKNGVEIYEGDIIELQYNRLGKRKVIFEKGSYNISDCCLNRCEIVGNIQENPELLK